MIKKNLLFALLLSMQSQLFFAQDIEVKKFELLSNDQTAVVEARNDINNVPCGLIKLQFDAVGLMFDGNIVGDVISTPSEYLIYIAKGSKRLNLKHQSILPTTIVFADYGITKIESNKTYRLVLDIAKPKLKVSTKKSIVVFNILPTSADLYIDNELMSKDDGGAYAVSLCHGLHTYSVKDGYFCLNNQVIQVKNNAKPINVNLSDFYSYLAISSMAGTSITLNNKYVGNEKWSGYMPPGNYTIEVAKNGFQTQARTITLYENDSINIAFPIMTAITGKISFKYKPDSANIYIDGVFFGTTPLLDKDISTGNHKIEIKKDYYKPETIDIVIRENQDALINGSLNYENKFAKIWIEAHNGDRDSQYDLAECYLYNRNYIDGWKKEMIDKNKAIYWYTKAAVKGSSAAQCALSVIYGNGKIINRDDSLSFYWANKAASQDDNHGCYLLGYCYAYGVGTMKDHKKAIKWLRKAILIDNNSAAEELLIKLGYRNEVPSMEERPSH